MSSNKKSSPVSTSRTTDCAPNASPAVMKPADQIAAEMSMPQMLMHARTDATSVTAAMTDLINDPNVAALGMKRVANFRAKTLSTSATISCQTMRQMATAIADCQRRVATRFTSTVCESKDMADGP